MKVIREMPALIGWLEGGELAEKMRDELQAVVAALNEAAGPKGKAKGSLTLKLKLEVAMGRVEITGEIASNKPKEERGSTILWVTEEGQLSTEHPRQRDMFDGPRAVERAAADA